MQRYPLIHKPKHPLNLPQITTPVTGEGRFMRMAEGGYGHVILQLEPNPDQDGCFMLWSVTPDATRGMDSAYYLTNYYLDDVYRGLCEAIDEVGDRSAAISYVPFPYENTNIRIIGGSEHLVDSKRYYYRRAAYLALKDAVAKVKGQPPASSLLSLLQLWYGARPLGNLLDPSPGVSSVPASLAATITQVEPYRTQALQDALLWLQLPLMVGMGLEAIPAAAIAGRAIASWEEAISPLNVRLEWSHTMTRDEIQWTHDRIHWVAREAGEWRIVRLFSDAERDEVRRSLGV